MEEQINSQISVLEKELETTQGTPCEVYSRIVGYFRAVKNWNPGKAAEYAIRKTYKV
jgi:anaerobic ribonucleoside-triphosphate reductase